jgi:O-glycosyl hydrolase
MKRRRITGGLSAQIERLECRRLLAVNVVIDANQRFQEIDGFGSALAWWTNSPYDQAAWRDMYFRDLGSSILRVDINIKSLSGPDNNLATPVNLVDDLQTNISQFNFAAQGVANFGGVAQASLTKKLDSFKLIGSLWTPPHWMKGEELNPVTGQLTGVQPVLSTSDSSGGSLIDTPENLQQFGRYVAAYVKGFEQTYGVPFYAISIQNELAFHEPYNSCVYTPGLYVKALKAVSDAFDHYGITTKIQGPEDVGVGSTSNLGILQRDFSYINAVRADPVAMADLDLYSIHGYATETSTPNRSPEMWRQYWSGRPAASYPAPNWAGISFDAKKSWMTETSGESQSWTGAFRIGTNAQDALTQGNVSAWLYWQTVDGSPANTGTLTAGTDTSSQKYNAAKHFFRYIRPGAWRVSATPSDPNGIYVSAFVQDSQKTLTVVLVNESTSQQTVNLSTIAAPLASFDIARRSSSTETWLDLGPISFTHGTAAVTLGAQSIVTLQGAIDNVKPVASGVAFEFEQSQQVRISFDENVGASLTASDLQIQNLTNPSANISVAAVSYDAVTNLAAFSFSPAVLPDGRYRATLPAANVMDAAGNPLISSVSYDFFALTGDANRDQAVDTIDFNTLASHFGQTGQLFSNGDFNYDRQVDTIDFNLLSSRFGACLGLIRQSSALRPWPESKASFQRRGHFSAQAALSTSC